MTIRGAILNTARTGRVSVCVVAGEELSLTALGNVLRVAFLRLVASSLYTHRTGLLPRTEEQHPMRIITTTRPAVLPYRIARYIWVQWADEPQPLKEGIPDHVPNSGISRFLEERCDKRMISWQDAGGDSERIPIQVTFS